MLLVQLFLAIELVNTGSAFMRVCEVFGFQPVKMKSDTNLQALRSIQLQLPRTAEKKLAAESCSWRTLASTKSGHTLTQTHRCRADFQESPSPFRSSHSQGNEVRQNNDDISLSIGWLWNSHWELKRVSKAAKNHRSNSPSRKRWSHKCGISRRSAK